MIFLVQITLKIDRIFFCNERYIAETLASQRTCLMFGVYIVNICVFYVRAHLRPSFLCLVQMYFFPLVFFSILIMVKAIK